MSFATEKEKPASERFMLLRFSAKYDFTDDMINVGGIIREVDLHKKPYSVKAFSINGLSEYTDTFTEVGSSSPGALQWNYNETTKKLRIGINGFNVYHYAEVYEYITGNIDRYAPSVPGVTTDSILWESKIERYPTINQSIDDITVGVFSIAGSDITIINDGNWLGKYLSPYWTVYNQGLRIWLCINDAANSKLIFDGIIVRASIAGISASFSVLDSFNKLNAPLSVGQPSERLYYTEDVLPGTASSMIPNDEAKPVTRHFMKMTSSRIDANGLIDESYFLRSICISFNTALSPTQNRRWSCGSARKDSTSAGALESQVFGTITYAAFDGAFSVYLNLSSYSGLYRGQKVRWTESSNVYYGTIVLTQNTTYLGNPVNLVIVTQISPVLITTSSVFTDLKAFLLISKAGGDPNTAKLFQTRDYDLFVDSSGLIWVSLFDNFESTNFNGYYESNRINPEADNFYYWASFSGVYNHATVIKGLIESAGMTANAASFSAAAGALTANVCFTNPLLDSTTISSYSEIIGKILQSTGGYLSINSDGEVVYELFETPTGVYEVNDSEYFGLNLEVEFQDISTEIVATNNHFIIQTTSFPSVTFAQKSYSATNKRARELHGIINTKYIEHVLDSMTATIDRVLFILSNRKARYSFSTANRNIDSNLGDDLQLASKYLAGDVSTTDLKIVSKTTNGRESSVSALDFSDL